MKMILPDGSVQEAEDELRVLRHTASHVLAQAVKRLYPETKLAIGPAIDDGFYYDFDREGGFTPEDLEKLEDFYWHGYEEAERLYPQLKEWLSRREECISKKRYYIRQRQASGRNL